MNCRYSIVIQWSDEDRAYVVSLPEFGRFAKTHGATYEEALKNAQEVLEMLIEGYEAEGTVLPRPATFGTPVPG
jgi:antitoxin HicB